MIWGKRWFQYSILLLLAFVWGSSFILMKIGLKSFSSSQAGAIRIIFASLVLLPFSIKNLKHIKRKDLYSLLIAGFIGSFFPAFLFMKAETRIDSSLAGMLNSLTPVFTVIVGFIFHKTTFRFVQILGLIVGLTGASGLIFAGSSLNLNSINSYAFYIVLATIFYAISINQIKSKLTHLTGVQITSLTFLFIGPVAFFYLLTTNLSNIVSTPSWTSHLIALAVLGVFGTGLAMLLMNSLIRYCSAVAASSVTYVIPVFAIMWGILDGEEISSLHIICMSLILIGIYLINKKNTTAKKH